MSDALYSDAWYRVADSRPQIRSQLAIHRHHYRGELWYVLENAAHRRVHRFTPAAYRLIDMFDGSKTVNELWEHARERLGDEAPTQDDLIQLLSQLHEADALTADLSPDSKADEQFRDRQSQNTRRNTWRSPLMWRIPLFDPDPILHRLRPLGYALFTTRGLLVWIALVAAACVTGVAHWQQLTENLSDRVLAPSNLVVLLLVFPVLKLIHEFGHALAVKAFGGEVHELGVMLLVFNPIPYVDASAASTFPRKRERCVVGAAGMMAEIFVAALALLAWTLVEPGVLRALLFNIVFIASVSTIMFNANPFLKFDGYSMLSDAIEIPNLSARGTSYLRYLAERYVLGNRRLPRPKSTAGARRWLFTHAVGSVVCRVLVMASICLFVAGKFFSLGVLLAVWAFTAWCLLPVGRGVIYLLRSPSLTEVRGRAVLVSVLLAVMATSLMCIVPAPLRTRAEGVVWVPDEAVLRAATDGFVIRFLVEPGATVRRGDPVIECADPLLNTEVQAREAQLNGLRARQDGEWIVDRVAAAVTAEEISRAENELESERSRVSSLILTSPCDGTLIVDQFEDLVGRYVRKGDPIAHVLNPADVVARVVVLQENVDLVRNRLNGTRIRLSESPGQVVPAVIRREVPEASSRLPSAALGTRGGGSIAVDPTDPDGVASLQTLFQFDVHFPLRSNLPHIGGRVFVRFDHGWEPIIARWYHRAKQVWEKNRG